MASTLPPDAPARAGDSAAAPAAPAIPAIKVAAAAARELIAAETARQAAAPTDPVVLAGVDEPVPTDEDGLELEAGADDALRVVDAEDEARWSALTPEEQMSEDPERAIAERDAAAAEALVAGGPSKKELVVDLPARNEGEEPFPVEFGDKESADRARQLVRAALRGDEARRLRDEAQAVRDQADEIQYLAKLDPTGLILAAFTAPEGAPPQVKARAAADQTNLVKYLLTRPGVFEANKDWLAGVIAQPEAIAGEGRLIEADFVTRRQAVEKEVGQQRAIAKNARQLIQTLDKTLDTMAPAAWDEEAKKIMGGDVLGDLRDFARSKNLVIVDPRVIPGLVQRRFKLLGMTPRSAAAVPGTSAAPAVTVVSPSGPRRTHVSAGTPVLTPDQLKAARTARAAGASAPPGAGSPVATIPKPPKGATIKQAADFARGLLASMSKRPS